MIIIERFKVMTANWQRWKNIMKCYPFSEDRLLKWTPPFIVQPKYDGIRCRAIPIQTGPKGNEYILVSSEENILHSVPHLNEMFSSLGLRCELDGELYHHGMKFDGEDGIASITGRTVNLHPLHKEIQFHCFDIINNQPQMRRLILIDNLKNLSPWLKISPFWLCESLDEIMKVYDNIISLGYEGIIVRHFNAPYELKRSTMIMKLKPKKEDIYKILGYKEEISIDGIPKDRLGSLICVGSDGTKFKVGSGFSEEDRINLWKEKELLLEKYVKIAYQHLTTSGKVPRFPIFSEVISYERALERDPSISSL
jgi:ATP-dependent DNA ligase